MATSAVVVVGLTWSMLLLGLLLHDERRHPLTGPVVVIVVFGGLVTIGVAMAVIRTEVPSRSVPVRHAPAGPDGGYRRPAVPPVVAGPLTPIRVGRATEFTAVVLPLPPWIARAMQFQSSFIGGRVSGHPLTVRGASLPGTSHREQTSPGQDAAGAAWIDGRNSLLVVVADGVGSQDASGEVSNFAVQQLFVMARDRRLDRHPLPVLVDLLATDVQRFVRKGKIDGATTLVVAEVRPGPGGAVVDVAGLGDSEAWLLDAGRWSALHTEFDSGSRAVRALPASEGFRVAQGRLRPGAVLLLASDGFAVPLGNGETVFAQELADRLKRPPRAVEFANLVDFESPLYHDDRTVVAVWMEGGPHALGRG